MLKKLALILIASLIISGCFDDSPKKELIVGTSPDYQPFEFKKDGEIIGFDIDLVKKIGKKLGSEITFIEIPFYRFHDALKDGTVDMVVAAITVTDEREKLVDFSDKYYSTKMSILFKHNHIKINSLNDLRGKTVGVQDGSIMESFLTDRAHHLTEVGIFSKDNVNDLIYDLKLGKLDAIIVDLWQAEELSNENKEFSHIEVKEAADHGFAIAFKKGNKLRDSVNKVIEQLIEFDWIHGIEEKWMHKTSNASEK